MLQIGKPVYVGSITVPLTLVDFVKHDGEWYCECSLDDNPSGYTYLYAMSMCFDYDINAPRSFSKEELKKQVHIIKGGRS